MKKCPRCESEMFYQQVQINGTVTQTIEVDDDGTFSMIEEDIDDDSDPYGKVIAFWCSHCNKALTEDTLLESENE